MNAELDLLRAVLSARSLAPLTQAGVTAEYFVGAEASALYKTITAHHARYSRVPAAATLTASFSELDLSEPDEPIEVYLDVVRKAHAVRILSDGVRAGVKHLTDDDPDTAVSVLQRSINTVLTIAYRGDTVDLTTTGDARWERYQALKDIEDGLRGVPTGFPTIDRITLGLQAQQLITIVGLPKDGKSTLLLTMAKYAHRHYYDHGVEFRPLVYGFEMSNDEQGERFDGWNAGIDVRKLRGGDLNVIEWKRLRKALDEFAEMGPFFLATGHGSLTGVAQLDERIEELNPDAVYVDGVYMMRDEISGEVNTSTALTNITRALKRLAQRRDIPIVITTQALTWKVGKGGVNAGSIGYSSSFFQDSDLLIAPEATDTEDIKRLKIIGSRNSANAEVLLRWDWASGTYEEITEDEGGSYEW